MSWKSCRRRSAKMPSEGCSFFRTFGLKLQPLQPLQLLQPITTLTTLTTFHNLSQPSATKKQILPEIVLQLYEPAFLCSWFFCPVAAIKMFGDKIRFF